MRIDRIKFAAELMRQDMTLVPYLNGSRNPKTEKLGKIAKALGVDPAEIIATED